MQKTAFITPEQSFDLRNRVLRGSRPVESCNYAEDRFETTFHIGVLENDKILSNGTLMLQAHKHFPQSHLPYRLRGMATDPEYQKQGHGKLILAAAEAELRKRGADLLWFNARVSAEEFYRKCGFLAVEEVFDIAQVGPHKVMYKWL